MALPVAKVTLAATTWGQVVPPCVHDPFSFWVPSQFGTDRSAPIRSIRDNENEERERERLMGCRIVPGTAGVPPACSFSGHTSSRTLSSAIVVAIFSRPGVPRANDLARCTACFAVVFGGIGGS